MTTTRRRIAFFIASLLPVWICLGLRAEGVRLNIHSVQIDGDTLVVNVDGDIKVQ
jgi:hypothetical protein